MLLVVFLGGRSTFFVGNIGGPGIRTRPRPGTVAPKGLQKVSGNVTEDELVAAMAVYVFGWPIYTM